MRISAREIMKTSLLLGGMLCFFCSASWASPVLVGPPPMVDGKPAPMDVVKKWGRLWYPAPLVGYYRHMEFAYDHAARKLYIDGQLSEMEALVVDGIVYLPVKPIADVNDLTKSQASEAARQQLYHNHPEDRGNPVLVSSPTSHPWAKQGQPIGRIIDLEPTGHSGVPAHMQPGAAPPQRAPEKLPGRLPRPGETATVNPTREPTVQIAPSHGIPRQVTAQGGQPEGRLVTPEQPKTLQPVPYKEPTVASGQPKPPPSLPDKAAFGPKSAQNKIFEVSVGGAALARSSKDGLLTLKLQQKNLSPVAQANLGSFAIRCSDGTRVEPVRSRSYLPGKALAPGQARDGELVFRLPREATPKSLELEGTSPLSLPLEN